MHFYEERTAANVASLQGRISTRLSFSKDFCSCCQHPETTKTPGYGHILRTRRANSRPTLRLFLRHELTRPLGGGLHKPLQVLKRQLPLPPRLGWTIRAENLLVLATQVVLEAFLPALRQVVAHSPAMRLHGVLHLPVGEAVENSTGLWLHEAPFVVCSFSGA